MLDFILLKPELIDQTVVVKGVSLDIKGYDIAWNKPDGEGTPEDPRMPLACVGLDLSKDSFSVNEGLGVVIIAADKTTHDKIKLSNSLKAK